MNFKNVKAERNTITRDTKDLEKVGTGNIFETIVVLSRRSNQLSQDLKKELNEKMEEFVIPNDTLEEVFENREQIEISKFYERLAKPQSIAIKELEEDLIYVRHPEEELDLELSSDELENESSNENVKAEAAVKEDEVKEDAKATKEESAS
jgi:DNA-directed RNA polymerase subunit K/omega